MSADTDHYDVHGARLAVHCAEPEVRAAVASRLRGFAADSPGADAVTVTLHGDRTPRLVPPPPDEATLAGTGRVVLTRAEGTVVWRADEDLLVGRFGPSAGLCCAAAGGVGEVFYDAADPDDRRRASHGLFTLVLVELLKRRGVYDVHAGGVVRDGRAVLLPANSGSGKTTLTLALVAAGFELLSDDLVLLRADGSHGPPTCLPFADEVDVTAQTGEWFDWLRPALATPKPDGFPKWPLRLEEWLPVRVAGPARPAVLVMPRVGGRADTRASRLSAADALQPLLNNALLTEPVSSQAHVTALSRLATGVPAYRLETGTDLDGAVRTVHRLLDETG